LNLCLKVYPIGNPWNLADFLQRNVVSQNPPNRVNANPRQAVIQQNALRDNILQPPRGYAYSEEDEGGLCLKESIMGLFVGFFFGIFGLIMM
jgi:hypothetical protein